MDKYYLTTAIDYANAAPHIGHAYEKIAADVIARYQRLAGKDVFFLTGTDEHGTKVEKTAEAAGKSPKAFVDETAALFELAWKKLLISHDYFIRTTEPRHQAVVQEIFRRMRNKGDVYLGKYKGLYCEGCEDYKREQDLDADGNCPNHKKAPKVMEEENYFFRLTKYKEPLRQWLSQEGNVLPDGRRKEVLNQLDDEDFGDFSVSRTKASLQWGIPVPDDENHVIYVWIDALTNYITGVGFNTDEALWKKYWPADLHLIGKDIVKFHCIYWPAMLMAADIELPKLVFGHGFITVEGQKMSKTLGNVLDPIELVDRFGADRVRYYLFAVNTFDQDGDFSQADFINVVDSHLANNWGNLCNRSLTLLDKNAGGKVPDATVEEGCRKLADEAQSNYVKFMEQFEFAKAIESILMILNEANRYLAEQKPWTLYKEGKNAEADAVLYTAVELLKRATVLLAPFTPTFSQAVWHQLGFEGDVTKLKLSDSVVSNVIPKGQALRNEGPVILRIADLMAAAAAK
jgi:methionyl-tRNA synthetase